MNFKYETAKKSYYTDGNEKKDVVAYRETHYILTLDWFSLRMPLWCRVPYEPDRHDTDKALGPYVHLYILDMDGHRAYTEFHVDNIYAKTSDRINDFGADLSCMSAYYSHNCTCTFAGTLPCAVLVCRGRHHREEAQKCRREPDIPRQS